VGQKAFFNRWLDRMFSARARIEFLSHSSSFFTTFTGTKDRAGVHLRAIAFQGKKKARSLSSFPADWAFFRVEKLRWATNAEKSS